MAVATYVKVEIKVESKEVIVPKLIKNYLNRSH